MVRKLTKLYRVEHKAKFATMEEAKKEANSIRRFIENNAKKNNWATKTYIGISENSRKSCEVTRDKTGKRGRPKNVVKPKRGKKIKKIPTHIHILVKANPAETVCTAVAKNINKRHRKLRPNDEHEITARKFPVDGKRGYYVDYVMGQSLYKREVEHDPDGILEDFSFQKEQEYYLSTLK